MLKTNQQWHDFHTKELSNSALNMSGLSLFGLSSRMPTIEAAIMAGFKPQMVGLRNQDANCSNC